ncbi:HEPN domain-containing protein [Clostridium perfringens]|uniref:ApeA N-terminal domain 1-containing protein n=1 Tax=Clostridium perfringens TaxID=1502 RepID=UPI00016BD432|nr:HEPN domain-containing protein [Clostridium perfringens]EDT77349.1 hypothetical protein AC7_1351 [Clostridium perfringens NCTC 8239]EIF6153562.1 hypothetical protein [Clostridium perfringens]ELC8353323.1 hypothetical protein [Clostridium perfringens]KAF2784473.1 hypothetical protein SV13_04850 [Clostridium perfringens]MCX0383121.1 hypothetical protein [Clostridium perfringens]
MEIIGYWNLPNDEEIAGVLKYKENEIILEVMGSFLDDPLEVKNREIIQGITKEGKEITLINCVLIKSSMSSNGICSEWYRVRYVIIGEKYDNIDEIKIKNIHSDYDYLNNWIDISNSLYKTDRKTGEINFFTSLPKKINHEIDDYSVNVGFKMNLKANLLSEFTYRQSAFIEFNFNKEIDFWQSIEKIKKFSDFMTICIGKTVGYGEIELKDINNKKIKVIDNNNKQKELASYDFKIRPCLLMFSDIKDRFSEIYGKWINEEEKLSPIINKLVSVREGERFDPQVEFMDVITAVETFSRRYRKNCKEDEELHKKRIKIILESVQDEDYKKWLDGKLKYSNEPNLRTRINSLLEEMNYLVEIKGSIKKNLVNKIVETRNYYTHFSEDKKENILSNYEAYYIYLYLEICLRLLILKEIGVSIIQDISSKHDCEDFYFINNFKKYLNKNLSCYF